MTSTTTEGYFIVEAGKIVGTVYASSAPSLQSGQTAIPVSDYSESVVGAAPSWPRAKRDGLLQASDWTQLGDAPLTADQVTQAKAYRVNLRNLPAVCTDAMAITWPAVPAFV